MAASKEQIQKAFMTYLIQDAQKNGVTIDSEEKLQLYAQSLGEDGLKAKYQEFMQVMQNQVSKAELGAKLEYIQKLTAPKFACGGKTKKKKACRGKKFDKGGEALKKTPGKKVVDDFKNRRVSHPADTIRVKEQGLTKIYDLSGKNKLFERMTHSIYKKLGRKDLSRVDLKDSERGRSVN